MRQYLESKITDLRQRIQSLDKQREAAAAELRAYDDALHHYIAETGDALDDGASTPPPGGFEMSPKWLAVMNKIMSYHHRSFNAGDMVRIGQELGFGTKNANARSQIAFYAKKGYIKRVRHGQYAITSKGQEAFNKEAPPAETEGAPIVTGGADTLPNRTEDR